MTQKIDDYERIKKELNWIRANYTNSDNIEDVIINLDNCKKIPHLKKDNYVKIVDDIISSNSYSVLLIDCSIIIFDYTFDKNNSIIFFSISYIPFYENEGLFEHQISKYLRFDYDPTAHKDIEHTSCHLHIGLEKNGFRIPVETKLYPLDIVYIILKYIYKENSKFSELIKLEEKENLLRDIEKQKLRLSIG